MRLLLIASAFLLCGAAPPAPSPLDIPDIAIPDGRAGKAYAPLIDQLRQGGHVILFRHERTMLVGDWDFLDFKDEECDRQRGLSPVGRESANVVGEIIRTLGIPVGPVIASTYCRAIDHGREAFGGAHLKTPALIGADGKLRTKTMVRAEIDALIAKHLTKDSNLVLIGHHGTLEAYSDRWFDEGDALILKRDADGRLSAVAHIPTARWDEILRDTRRQRFEPPRK